MHKPALSALFCVVVLAVTVIAMNPPPRDAPTQRQSAMNEGGGSRAAAAAPPVSAALATLDGISRSGMVLEAAAAVSRLCGLVEVRRFAEAQTMLERPAVWSRRQMRACSGRRFTSARLIRTQSQQLIRLDVRLTAPSGSDLLATAPDIWVRFTLQADPVTRVWLITGARRHGKPGPKIRV